MPNTGSYQSQYAQTRARNAYSGKNTTIRTSTPNKAPLASSTYSNKIFSATTKPVSPPIITVTSSPYKSQPYGFRREMRAPYLDPLPDSSEKKKTLVLDLDETLIHSAIYSSSRHDFVLKFAYGSQRYYVLKRPYLAEFLARVGELFEVVVFTCGEKDYANVIIKQIDPNGVISKVLHRDYCSIRGGLFTKDLGKLGRNLKDVIFVDNWEMSFMLQPDNGYKIKDFISDKNDCELKNLIPFLEYLNKLDDVRPIPKKFAEFRSMSAEERNMLLQQNKLLSASVDKSSNDKSSDENSLISEASPIKSSPAKSENSENKRPPTADILDKIIFSPLRKKENETPQPESPINEAKKIGMFDRVEIDYSPYMSPYTSSILKGPSQNNNQALNSLYSKRVPMPIHRLW